MSRIFGEVVELNLKVVNVSNQTSFNQTNKVSSLLTDVDCFEVDAS